MPRGTVRFWAAARAAAGVPEEPYDAATLAEALAAARARHGEALAKVLDRCSYVVDGNPVGGRAHDAVPLSEGGSVEVLPPFAGGAGDRVSAPTAVVDAMSHRAFGIAAGAVAAALAGLALVGLAPLAVAVFAVQVVLVLAWLAVLDVPGSGGVFVLTLIAAGVMDGVVAAGSEPDIGRAAGVVGVGVVLGLLYQLARKPRIAVTLSFAGTLAGFVFALSATCYVALRVQLVGDRAEAAALFGVGAALGVARLVDLVLPRPAAAPGSRRGVAGMLLGLAVAAAVGWAYGGGQLDSDRSVRLALIAAVVALLADLAVDAVLCAAPPSDDRARSALPPLGVLLPVVLAGPAVYVAGRILVG